MSESARAHRLELRLQANKLYEEGQYEDAIKAYLQPSSEGDILSLSNIVICYYTLTNYKKCVEHSSNFVQAIQNQSSVYDLTDINGQPARVSKIYLIRARALFYWADEQWTTLIDGNSFQLSQKVLVSKRCLDILTLFRTCAAASINYIKWIQQHGQDSTPACESHGYSCELMLFMCYQRLVSFEALANAEHDILPECYDLTSHLRHCTLCWEQDLSVKRLIWSHVVAESVIREINRVENNDIQSHSLIVLNESTDPNNPPPNGHELRKPTQYTGPGSVCWMMLCPECEILMQEGETPFLEFFKLFIQQYRDVNRVDFGQKSWFSYYSATVLWRTIFILGGRNQVYTREELLAIYPKQQLLRKFILRQNGALLPTMYFMIDRPRNNTPVDFHSFFVNKNDLTLKENRHGSSTEQQWYIHVQCHLLHWYICADSIKDTFFSATTRIESTHRLILPKMEQRDYVILNMENDMLEKRVQERRTESSLADREAAAKRQGYTIDSEGYACVTSVPERDINLDTAYQMYIDNHKPCYDFNRIKDRRTKLAIRGHTCDRKQSECKYKHVCIHCGTPNESAGHDGCHKKQKILRSKLQAEVALLDVGNSVRRSYRNRTPGNNKGDCMTISVAIPKSNIRESTCYPCLIEVIEPFNNPDPIIGNGIKAVFYMYFQPFNRPEEWENVILTGKNRIGNKFIADIFSHKHGSTTLKTLHLFYYQQLQELMMKK